MQPRKIFIYTFVGSILILSLLYGYQGEILMRPHGIHIWRQCDCAQFALNYYTESMNFFEPRLSWCTGNDGKMGSEFPIIYYSAALLYKVFGVHDYFIRFINLLFFFIGLFYLFKAISLFLEDEFYGLILALMAFTSPILIDYANNFLPDVPAISLSFIGIYYFLSFHNQNKSRELWKATFFFALAGLIKVTALMSFLAIIGTMLLVFFFKLNKREEPVWLEHKKTLLAFIFLPLLISAVWIVYIKQYNLANNNTYFLTTILPIWNLDAVDIQLIAGRFEHYWLREFIYRDFTNTMPFVFLLCLFIPYRKNASVVIWLCMLIAAGAIYLLLFFTQFTVHDYYLICLIPIPIAICAVFLLRVKKWKPAFFKSKVVKVLLLVLFIVMIHHGRRLNTIREKNESWSYYSNSDFYKLETNINRLGIKPADKIISIGDGSTGESLYLLKRRGWTSLALTQPKATETDIENCKAMGAKYVVISDSGDERITPEAKNMYLKNELYNSDGVKIYKL